MIEHEIQIDMIAFAEQAVDAQAGKFFVFVFLVPREHISCGLTCVLSRPFTGDFDVVMRQEGTLLQRTV